MRIMMRLTSWFEIAFWRWHRQYTALTRNGFVSMLNAEKLSSWFSTATKFFYSNAILPMSDRVIDEDARSNAQVVRDFNHHPLSKKLHDLRRKLQTNRAFSMLRSENVVTRAEANSLTVEELNPFGGYFLALRALHVLTRPEQPIFAFSADRRKLPDNMPAQLSNALKPFAKDQGWVGVVNRARNMARKWTLTKDFERSDAGLHPLQGMIDQIEKYAGKE
ncbi:hypothetical protein F5878DRAFT_643906, partial [Lentinula raphanica]